MTMTEAFQNFTPTQRRAIQLFSNHPKIFKFGNNTHLMGKFGIPSDMWKTKRFLKMTAPETKDDHPFLPKPPRDLPLALTAPFHCEANQGTISGSFKDVPLELLSLIFSFVSLRDFITFSTVSKHWYSVTLDDSLWRLQFLRMMDRCPSADWLHRLFDRLDASSSTNWRISFIQASKFIPSFRV